MWITHIAKVNTTAKGTQVVCSRCQVQRMESKIPKENPIEKKNEPSPYLTTFF